MTAAHARRLSAHLPGHPLQPHRPAPCQFFIAVAEKAGANGCTPGSLLLHFAPDRRGRTRYPPRSVRSIRPHPDNVYPAKAGRTDLPIRPKRHPEAGLGSVAPSPWSLRKYQSVSATQQSPFPPVDPHAPPGNLRHTPGKFYRTPRR